MAMFSRFSVFLRSGANPGTKAPGEPQILLPRTGVGQEVGVTPPDPEKYGTFAARWVYSQRNDLCGHPFKSPRHIPSLIRIPRVLGEIRRARSSRRAIDRRQQNQIPPGIINLPAAECQAILVVDETRTV